SFLPDVVLRVGRGDGRYLGEGEDRQQQERHAPHSTGDRQKCLSLLPVPFACPLGWRAGHWPATGRVDPICSVRMAGCVVAVDEGRRVVERAADLDALSGVVVAGAAPDVGTPPPAPG